MPKEKIKKQSVLICKCDAHSVSGDSMSFSKNCKCRTSGRKEREYEKVIVEKR